MPPNSVPGLQRPVSLGEYAKLESVREADVLTIIGQLKIPAAFFQGQWYVEAPPGCEARLAQLRGDKAGTKAVPAPVPQPPTHPQVAQHPQPIDYGLSESDILLHQPYPPSAHNLKYRHERDSSAFWRLLGIRSIIDRKDRNQERRSRAAYLKFEEARLAYEAIEAAKRKAARDAELRKRSYWTFLDGYAFERATTEVLNKHQFNAVVTPGSGDGGVDIEVTRNGLKGVVQCKAHMARVGPHVVRDLYGVIHHRAASFGIIVSLGGFSRGAVEFARDKSILFLDLDDLIAMQEGRDVLAAAFAPSGKG